MFNLGALAANVLNSLDNAAKDTLEEPRMSATALRSQRHGRNNGNGNQDDQSEEEDNGNGDIDFQEAPVAAQSKPPLVVRLSSSNMTSTTNPHSRSTEKFVSPSKSSTKNTKDRLIVPGNDYALTFESSAPSSNVSNDGDEAVDDGAGSTIPGNVSSSQLSESTEAISIAITTPFVGDDEQPPSASSIPSTPISIPKHGEVDQDASATQAAATPAAAAGPPTSLLGSIVNSAKKLATSTPGVTAEGPPSVPSSAAADGDRAGKDNRDKEILLLKKTLKKKNAEIEKLNRECLDFEEQTNALKQEVQEAWANYKTSQERAAAVESELQDEIRQIQKAKLSDKQVSVAQLSKMGEEVAEAMRQVAAAQAQRAEVQGKLDAALQENATWEERLISVQEELAQAQTGTVQGVAALREELRVMQLNTEQMRVDHSSLLRQNQLRQAELERENAELVASLTQQQKELQRLQHQNQSNSDGSTGMGMGGGNRDYLTLQQELIELTASFEKEKDRSEDLDRRLRIAEREARAAQINYEDEKRRSSATIDELGAKVADLEGRSNHARRSNTSKGGNTGFLLSAGVHVEGEEGQEKFAEHAQYATNSNSGGADGGARELQPSVADYEKVVLELHEQRVQSQNLSKLLLKKQGAVLELQAERSALKSRLIDMQTRCSEAERQLASMRDLEGGDFSSLSAGGDQVDNLGDISGGASTGVSGGGGGLLRRGGGGRMEMNLRSNSRDTKVISDLERFGVKPGARVTRAVNMIDSWTISTGRFLRVYPLARLGFVFYLLLLHLWVLFILVMQTHSLELDTDPHEQVMH